MTLGRVATIVGIAAVALPLLVGGVVFVVRAEDDHEEQRTIVQSLGVLVKLHEEAATVARYTAALCAEGKLTGADCASVATAPVAAAVSAAPPPVAVEEDDEE